MSRNRLLACLAFAGLSTATAVAVDPPQNLGRYRPSDDVTTADTETVGGWHHHYRYPSYYHRGFGGGWGGGYYNSFSYYHAPRFYAPPVYHYYSAPRFYYPSVGFYSSGYFGGGFCGINGTAETAGVTANLAMTSPQRTPDEPAERMPSAFARPSAGTFRYDGGPTSPVPLPKPDGQRSPEVDRIAPVAPRPMDDTTLIGFTPKKPSDLKPATAGSANRFKAYGEK